MADNVITINYNLVPGKSGSKGAVRSSIERTALEMKNLIIENVGFYVRKGQEKQLTKNIQANLAKVVDKELNEMGRKINQLAVGLGARNFQPIGSLSITGATSRAMQGQTQSVTVASGTSGSRLQDS
jgi:hypothetical protein